ncbi:hypothetical protein LIER_35939 [Lithospermum erythrorhizon]|uniref:Gag-pol polyprotein n=1 Tax=Lithospermum erythrorhizon TaxID=34254 RepID=A0AAV3NYG2_LITER
MEASKEGRSISRPPLLHGSNYPYWKAKMTAFLKSMDSKTWKSILHGWTLPTQVAAESEGQVIKSDVDWTPAEDELALAKEPWEILQTAYEGTPKVRMSGLQQLTTKCETVKMEKDETI